ncbi:hypothetical protein [Halorientalis halophila]|uniref:hypothetical protein n=1 Tax=Halorientalis halophila TaxID=3108499 RepID=UPI003009C0E2
MDDRRVLGLGLLVVAALLLANPLLVFQNPDEVNEVRVLEDYDGTPAANYTYAELSPRAQELLDEARAADSGRTVFHGNENRPEEFAFVDEEQAVGIAGNVYRIEDGSERYHVRAFERPSVGTETNRSQGLLGLGLVLALMGVVYIRWPQPMTVGAVNGAVGAVAFAFNGLFRYTDLLGPLGFVGGWVTLLLAVIAAIVSLGYLLYRVMREKQMAGEL